MGRYTHNVFAKCTRPRYIVVFGLQWQILECQPLQAGANLSNAMTAAVERLAGDGWLAEGDARFGFVFIRRSGERRLLILTERDPYNKNRQSFTPFA
jgi:hypothetical protein